MGGGYSLTELVSALGVSLIIATLGVPGLVRALDEYGLIAAAGAMASHMQAARAIAVTYNMGVELRFDSARKAYLIAEAYQGRALTSDRFLPAGVEFAQLPSKPLRFHSRGNVAPAGAVVLRNRSGATLRVVVNPSGRIRWGRR